MPKSFPRTLAAALWLALAGSALAATPHILLFPAVGHPGEVAVHGRVLKQAPSGGSSTFSKNLRRLTSSDWAGAPVEVRLGGQQVSTTAGAEGLFEVSFRFAEGALAPGLHEVEARVPGAAARGTARLVADQAPFLVISDFDDTVALTHVTSRRRLFRAALLQDHQTHPPVEGMSAFYRCLVEDRIPTPGLAFVSGTPQQYAPRMAAFLVGNGFPLAALYLRDLGPRTLSGYKQPEIRKLLGRMKQNVILVGDSGEADPEVYAQIRREHPDRVLDIYIRDAGRAHDPARFAGMVLFKNAKDAAAHALSRGYLRPECFDQAFGATAAEGG